MDRIMVGMDGSSGAETARAWALAVAHAVGAQLVEASSDGIPGPGTGAVARIHLEGDPRSALAGAAASSRADLVVVGSSGVRWWPAVHQDHVAHHLVCHTERPVAIVPQGTPAELPDQVVVGVDGSPGSDAAVRWLATAPAPLTRRVLAVHALTAPVPARVAAGQGAPVGEDQVRGWAAPLLEQGLRVATACSGEDPVAALRAAAGEGRASVIVLGGRPVDEHHPLRLGSVALRALTEARHPVIVVPPSP